MKMRQRRYLVSAVIVIVAAASFVPGQSVSITRQWLLFDALRTTAAIIFGVMGAWLAIVFPRALEVVIKERRTSDPRIDRASRVLLPLVYSTILLSIVLLYGVVRAVLDWQLEVLWPYHRWFRGGSFSLLVGLTLAQLYTLWMTLVPGLDHLEELEHRRQRREAADAMNSEAQKRPRAAVGE